MRQFAAVVIVLACNLYVRLRIYVRRCGHRDEACAWSCGLPFGHAGEHDLWLTDERASAIGLR